MVRITHNVCGGTCCIICCRLLVEISMVETRRGKGKQKAAMESAPQQGHGKRKRGEQQLEVDRGDRHPGGAYVLFW